MKKERFTMRLIGQLFMMACAVLLGGGVSMAALTNPVVETVVPEAQLANPTEEISTPEGGKAVFPEQSVTTGKHAAPEVYEDQYDKLITEVRIARTPLDQISRRARRTQRVKSMEFKYATIDYLPIETTLSSAYTETASPSANQPEVELSVTNAGIFNRRDLIVVHGVNGYASDGTTAAGDLMLWVKNRDGNTKLSVIAVNGKKISTYTGQVPSISTSVKLTRVAKACAELDSQAPGYAIFPVTSEQYNQKFMAQVEQSTIDALTAKRFDISLSDQEEATLADMRLGMEGVFLFGVKSVFTDPDTQRNVWTTGGIWNTPGLGTKSYSAASPITIAGLIDWTKEMFTGPAAGKSNKRVVLCGSSLLATLQKLFVSSQYITNTFKRWDLEFTEFTTTFGSFEFILDEVFDLHGMPDNGLIIDPDYLQRYTFEPFGRNTLDLDAQGTRDSKAIVLREISSLVLKSPNNHAKIVKS